MEIQKPKDFNRTSAYRPGNEDYVEAEIVDNGKSSSRAKKENRKPHNRQTNHKKAFASIKYRIMGLLLVVGIVLTLFGFVLTSTIIGAIIGIPFMILGISLLSLFGKLLFSKKNPAIFKTFRF